MPTLTPASLDIVARSLPPQAATAWARFEQPRSVRAGRRLSSEAAWDTRSRYAVRLALLRSVTRSVTSATTGCRCWAKKFSLCGSAVWRRTANGTIGARVWLRSQA
jgi:hypothetical protein